MTHATPEAFVSSPARGSRINYSGYRGTVIELVKEIPPTCLCKEHVGKPGALVWWDIMDTNTDDPYPEILPPNLLTDDNLTGSMQYMPLEKI